MTELKKITCGNCKEVFAIATDLYNVLMRSEQTWYCPHGHPRHFPLGPSAEDTLRQERDRLKQQLAEKDDAIRRAREQRELAEESAAHERRRVAAAKGQVTRLKSRAAAGVCPCCTRHFTNLERHMASEHPGFTAKPDDADKIVRLKTA